MKLFSGFLGLAPASDTRSKEPASQTLRFPNASPEALKLAIQMWASSRPEKEAQTFLFVPVKGASASLSAADSALAMLELNRGPVMILSLREDPSELLSRVSSFQRLEPMLQHQFWTIEGSPFFAVARIADPKQELMRSVSADCFSSFLDFVHKRFSCVLIDADDIDRSIAASLVALHCAAVILAVRAGSSTVTDVQRTQRDLARARANVLGFVLDERR